MHFGFAVNKRKAREFYAQLRLHASVNQAKVTQEFDEMFPQFSDLPPPEVLVDQTPETAKLMDTIAQGMLADLEAEFNAKPK